MIDFIPFQVHIITQDAYIAAQLLLPQRPGLAGKTPRFLDVLNSPSTFLKNPGEVGSSSTIILVNGTRNDFHGGAAQKFKRLYLRLDSVLLGSDEVDPAQAGTGQKNVLTGQPGQVEIMLRGGLRVWGVVRGGAKLALFPRRDHPFIAATDLRYKSPLSPQELKLNFAAINGAAIESVIPEEDLQNPE